mgnify:FL=1
MRVIYTNSQMSIHFRDLTSPQIKAAADAGTLLLLPLAQTEEHGNHLPVGTDTFIAEHVCDATARRLSPKVPTLVLPPIEYGYSGKVMTQWAGTFTIPPRLMIELIVEINKSVIAMGFRKIIIVNTHGHHQHLAVVAAREIADATGVDVAVLMPNNLIGKEFNEIRKSPPGGACHGGEYETSLVMHFGHDVDLSRADKSDFLKDSSEFCSNDMLAGGGKDFWSTWYRQPSNHGIYGDPTVASADTGKKTFDAIIEKMVAFCTEFHRFIPSSS